MFKHHTFDCVKMICFLDAYAIEQETVSKTDFNVVSCKIGPRTIADLVNITSIIMVFGIYNELVLLGFINIVNQHSHHVNGGPTVLESSYTCFTQPRPGGQRLHRGHGSHHAGFARRHGGDFERRGEAGGGNEGTYGGVHAARR